jgi:hypothetical protein
MTLSQEITHIVDILQPLHEYSVSIAKDDNNLKFLEKIKQQYEMAEKKGYTLRKMNEKKD